MPDEVKDDNSPEVIVKDTVSKKEFESFRKNVEKTNEENKAKTDEISGQLGEINKSVSAVLGKPTPKTSSKKTNGIVEFLNNPFGIFDNENPETD